VAFIRRAEPKPEVVAARVADMQARLPVEVVPQGVTVLNSGFVALERMRQAQVVKARPLQGSR